MSIQTVAKRKLLASRREPYWHLLAQGRHVGYRRTENGGTWCARAYDDATRKRKYKALPEVAALPANMQFDEACRRARDWFLHMEQGGESDEITVWQACENYVEHLRITKNDEERAAEETLDRFIRDVRDQPIARIKLTKLAPRHVEEWKNHVVKRPAKVSRRGRKFQLQEDRETARTAASVNRDLTALRAALNLAKARRYVTTDVAWQQVLKPISTDGGRPGRREVYLDKEQRGLLLKALGSVQFPHAKELVPFVRALCMLPLRPGVLARLRVADYDQRTQTLRLGTDKRHDSRVIDLLMAR